MHIAIQRLEAGAPTKEGHGVTSIGLVVVALQTDMEFKG